MRIRLLAIALVFLLLAGCGLAQPDAENLPPAERFIGFLLTFEPLGGRVEAEVTENGVSFPVEGLRLISYSYEAENGTFYSLAHSDGVSMNKLHTNVTDEGVFDSMSATLCLTESRTVYANPVYLSSAGAVYAEPGAGMAAASGAELRRSEAAGGFGFSVALAFEIMGEPRRCRVLFMDENNAILAAEELPLDALPEALTPPVGAAYAVCEQEDIGGELRFSFADKGEDLNISRRYSENIVQIAPIQVLWKEETA